MKTGPKPPVEMRDGVPWRRCAGCREWKPETDECFYRRPDAKDRFVSRCKGCQVKAAMQWNEAHPDRLREAQSRYARRHREHRRRLETQWRQAHRERVRATAKAWEVAHPEQHRQIRRAAERRYRARHRDRLREKARQRYAIKPWNSPYDPAYRHAYWLAHREQAKAQTRAYFARKRGAEGTATPEQIAARVAYYGGRCYLCGGPYEEIDHVIPLADGGSHWPANQRPICARCNRSKGARRLRRACA